MATYQDHICTIEERRRHGNTPLVVVGLLEHENKMSVLNFVLRRTEFHTLPIQSKVRYVPHVIFPLLSLLVQERLIFHTGLRRFSAPTTFSQHTMGANKHKVSNYFLAKVETETNKLCLVVFEMIHAVDMIVI